MNREIPFEPNQICDNCGKLGSFDFMGDYFCDDCLESEKQSNIVPEIEWLDNCENCWRHGVARDGICVYCGCGPRIGTDGC